MLLILATSHLLPPKTKQMTVEEAIKKARKHFPSKKEFTEAHCISARTLASVALLYMMENLTKIISCQASKK